MKRKNCRDICEFRIVKHMKRESIERIFNLLWNHCLNQAT